ncbi:hypothetical protein AURDEDRAFT_127110 [Auricularia subglabra TFB-10046 SS5]|uniref:Uncharacterized protein n=1 Tax=Auricularia subglabra (strain TFB-10046 / SS5) TaxID=717982 RepID=J0LK82_AURST|nr:hypothetical protein AURDEDRAFT_127110 [Auricularia subglabra TFB-10046 SS5]
MAQTNWNDPWPTRPYLLPSGNAFMSWGPPAFTQSRGGAAAASVAATQTCILRAAQATTTGQTRAWTSDTYPAPPTLPAQHSGLPAPAAPHTYHNYNAATPAVGAVFDAGIRRAFAGDEAFAAAGQTVQRPWDLLAAVHAYKAPAAASSPPMTGDPTDNAHHAAAVGNLSAAVWPPSTHTSEAEGESATDDDDETMIGEDVNTSGEIEQTAANDWNNPWPARPRLLPSGNAFMSWGPPAFTQSRGGESAAVEHVLTPFLKRALADDETFGAAGRTMQAPWDLLAAVRAYKAPAAASPLPMTGARTDNEPHDAAVGNLSAAAWPPSTETMEADDEYATDDDDDDDDDDEETSAGEDANTAGETEQTAADE